MLFSIEGAVRTYLQRGDCKFEIADQKASSSLQNFFDFEMVMKCWLRLATQSIFLGDNVDSEATCDIVPINPCHILLGDYCYMTMT